VDEKHIKKIAQLITEDPDIFNENWEELGIENPFNDRVQITAERLMEPPDEPPWILTTSAWVNKSDLDRFEIINTDAHGKHLVKQFLPGIKLYSTKEGGLEPLSKWHSPDAAIATGFAITFRETIDNNQPTYIAFTRKKPSGQDIDRFIEIVSAKAKPEPGEEWKGAIKQPEQRLTDQTEEQTEDEIEEKLRKNERPRGRGEAALMANHPYHIRQEISVHPLLVLHQTPDFVWSSHTSTIYLGSEEQREQVEYIPRPVSYWSPIGYAEDPVIVNLTSGEQLSFYEATPLEQLFST
jgi:hypothetical protein